MNRRKLKFGQSLPLNLERLDVRDLPSAALPFADGFESAALGPAWTTNATNNGRVLVSTQNGPDAGSRHVVLDNSSPGILSRSELTLHLDLAGSANSVLSFRQKEFNDVDHAMPATFSGSINADGVALSVDGVNWKRMVSLTGLASQNSYQTFTFNLAEFAAANALTLSADTMIRFQTYGNAVAPNGGMAFDEISVASSGSISGRVYSDTNQDGVYQAGEPLAAGRTVYLDADSSGTFTSGREVVVFSEQLPAPIFDQKRSLYPINVYVVDGYTVTDVDVTIALAHTYTADLDISLISPDGTRVLLTSDNGGNGDNYFVTRFDDDATNPITGASAPFSGTFRPEGKLSDFAGDSFDGVWYLEIVDDAAGDSGTLAAWSIDLIQSVTKTVNQTLPDVTVWSMNLNGDAFSFYNDLNVRVNIDHPNVADLKLELVAALGESMVLSANNGGTGNNYTNTVFDDSATVSISAGAAPFTGRFKPQEPIGAFLDDLGYISGGFELKVTDSKAGSVAKINDFTYDFISTFTAGTDPVYASNPGFPVKQVPIFIRDLTGPIIDLDVITDIDHAYPDKLTVELRREESPTGKIMTSGNGAGGQDFPGTVFDDEAMYVITSAKAPFAGSYRPESALAYFDGQDPNGTWNLRITNSPTSFGELNWAALVLRTAESFNDITVRTIEDQQTTTATLNVAGFSGGFADLNLRLNLQHTYDADLDVLLIAPNGKSVEVFSDVGGTGDNFTSTVLDDEAATGIAAGVAPFTGSFRPENPLSAFDGLDPNGTWTLSITDDAPGDSGLLLAWSLQLTGGERQAVTDANGDYSFDNLAPGSKSVRLALAAREKPIFPSDGKYTVPVTWGSAAPDRDFGFIADTTLPTLTFTAINSAQPAPVASIDAIFSEPVSGVDIADFSFSKNGLPVPLTGATVSTSDNISWTIGNLAGLHSGDGSYQIKFHPLGSGVLDAANNSPSPFSTPTKAWVVDSLAPQVNAFTPNSLIVNDALVGPGGFYVIATFSEPMDITVHPVLSFPAEVPAGSLNFTIGGWSNSQSWTGYFNVADLGTTLADIDLAISGAKDLAGNMQAPATFLNLIDLDTQNPVVTTVSSTTADGTYGLGAPVNLTIQFSEPVTLNGTLNVHLNSGAVMTIVGPQTGTNLSGIYIVGAGEASADLNVNSISLPAGTLRDAAANAAVLTVQPVNLAGTAAIAVNGGITVTGLTVNDGDPQRSRLTRIRVDFSTPVTPAALNGLKLTRTAATANGAVGTVVDVANGLTVTPLAAGVVLTFANISNAGLDYGSLADGRWRLSLPAINYASPLNDANLRRLFGDANNDGTVDGSDFATFGAAFGSTGASPFDFNFDGTVDAIDFGAFGNRFGLTL